MKLKACRLFLLHHFDAKSSPLCLIHECELRMWCRFAIYLPLFLPVGLPLILSLSDVWKWIQEQRRRKRAADQQNRDEHTASAAAEPLCSADASSPSAEQLANAELEQLLWSSRIYFQLFLLCGYFLSSAALPLVFPFLTVLIQVSLWLPFFLLSIKLVFITNHFAINRVSILNVSFFRLAKYSMLLHYFSKICICQSDQF